MLMYMFLLKLFKGSLKSQALEYTVMHLSAAVESVRQMKVVKEEQELEHENDVTVSIF